MKFKNLLLTLTLSSSVLLTPTLAFAQTASPNANQSTKLADLHSRCDTAISQRLTSLNNDQSRVNALTKLSASDKSTFLASIATNVSGLTAQKTKCDSDTDLATLKTDYQNVFLNFRIYAVFLPQTNLLVASDTMGVTADNETTLMGKLQTRVTQMGNPSNLTTLLTDMQNKIADAKTQYSNVESLVTPLNPSNYNNNPAGTKTAETAARADIKTGAGDLKTAYQDAVQIRADLKTPAPTATP